MNENQITGDDLAALMKIVPPATRSDCPGELYIGACERSLGEAFCRLRERGLVSVGLGPTSAPSRVIAF